MEKLQVIPKILQLSHDELYEIIDLASKGRSEIPMDLMDSIKENKLVQVALRKAREKEKWERGAEKQNRHGRLLLKPWKRRANPSLPHNLLQS